MTVRTYEEIKQEDDRLREEAARSTAAIDRARRIEGERSASEEFRKREKREREIEAAKEEAEVLGRHAQRCTSAARAAERTVNDFRREHAVRVAAVVEGVEQLVFDAGADASAALDAALAACAKRIALGDRRVLTELTTAFLALHPEMVNALRDTLRERVPALPARSDCTVSGLGEADYESALAVLQEQLAAALSEAQEARDAADAATYRLRRAERRG